MSVVLCVVGRMVWSKMSLANLNCDSTSVGQVWSRDM